MQFLVYLTILMVALSTVLLEVHWLTSPAPQPKPTVQAGAPHPPPKVEGPNAALSPIYPTKLDAPRPAESNSQAQIAPASTPAPAAPAAQTVSPQQPATAQTQSVASQQPAAAPQLRQKNSAETTGAAVREDNTRQGGADPASASNRNDNPQRTAQGSSGNRCDVQACASAYRSFRASDCTYQPFDGVRQLCEKSPGQRMAREREQPERRRLSRDTEARYLDRSTVGRRLADDDVRAEFDDSDRGPPAFFFFGRRPRW
jgi:hypothetical protein